MFSCKREEVTLHGDLTGIITDATTSEPIQGVGVKLSPVDDTTRTGSDGTYLFSNITPGEYDILVSKTGYEDDITEYVYVFSAKTTTANFALEGIPVLAVSTKYLDFEFDRTILSSSISNIGIGNLLYSLEPSQDWISVNPESGNVTNETDSIIITIDRTGLSDSIYKETIEIIYGVDKDIITVYLNGLMDIDNNYYKVVNIETEGEIQTWMAENLRVTKAPDGTHVESYDYGDPSNIYGRLYLGNNAMYGEDIPKAQGICPDGWHIPDSLEFNLLKDNYTAVDLRPGGSTGFDGLYGGYWWGSMHSEIGITGNWLVSNNPLNNNEYLVYILDINKPNLYNFWSCTGGASSVRCIKDTPLVK